MISILVRESDFSTDGLDLIDALLLPDTASVLVPYSFLLPVFVVTPENNNNQEVIVMIGHKSLSMSLISVTDACRVPKSPSVSTNISNR